MPGKNHPGFSDAQATFWKETALDIVCIFFLFQLVSSPEEIHKVRQQSFQAEKHFQSNRWPQDKDKRNPEYFQ